MRNESHRVKIKVMAWTVPSGGSREGSVPCLFQLLVAAGKPWHSFTCNCITPTSVSIITSSYKGTCYWISGPLTSF